MICSVCQRSFFTGRFYDLVRDTFFHSRLVEVLSGMQILKRHVAHHSTLESLKQSLNANCSVCNIVWANVSKSTQDWLQTHEDTLWRSEFDGDEIHPCWFSISETSGNDFSILHWTRCSNSAYERQTLRWSADMLGSSTSTSPRSPANAASLALKWIEACVKSHKECQEPESTDGNFLPTRLLDVTGGEGLDWRICETNNLLESKIPRYLTLSHCWGTAQFLQLTSANESSLKKGSTLTELPLTFQQAIEMTRRLGERYLWIDSLCILQDSVEDWKQESAVMHQVYLNGYLNIAATYATSGEEGLYRFENSEGSRAAPSVVSAWIDRPNKTYYLHDHTLWSRNIEGGHLNSRGWVLQERALAPRILHFAWEQVFWECRHGAKCESYPDGVQPEQYARELVNLEALSTDWDHRLKKPQPLFPGINQTGVREFVACRPDPYSYWHSTMAKYMQSKLTRSSDKLIAISGVAKRMQEVVAEDFCLCGLWGSRLELQLCWATHSFDANGNPASRPSEYRAPSWSWASMDAPLWRYDGGEADMSKESWIGLIDIHDVRVNPIDADPKVQPRLGFIELTGCLVLGDITELDPREHRGTMIAGTHELRTTVCCDVLMPPSKGYLYFLPVFAVSSLNHTSYGKLFGLMLSPEDQNAEPQLYVRYGYFSIGLSEVTEDIFGLKFVPHDRSTNSEAKIEWIETAKSYLFRII